MHAVEVADAGERSVVAPAPERVSPAALALPAMLRSVCDAARDILGADAAAVYLLDERGGLRLDARCPVAETVVNGDGREFASDVLRRGGPVVVPDVGEVRVPSGP